MKKNRYVFSAIMFAITAVLVILMIPRGGRYLQRFNLGDRWRGETLTAPFDFSITKSEAEVLADRQHAESTFIPVYSLDANTAENIWKQLQESLELAGQPVYFQNTVERALQFIYSKGVATNLDISFTDSQDNTFIRIDNNGTLETVSTQEVFTPRTAADYMSRQTAAYVQPLDYDWSLLLVPNLSYNQSLNTSLREREFRNVAATKGIVYANEVIVSKNQIVDQTVYNKLNSLRQEYRSRIGVGNTYVGSLVGHALIVVILMLITYLFLFYFRKDFVVTRSKVSFILLVYLLMIGLCSLISRTENLSVYIIPFAIVPIYILTFLDMRMSVYELITVLLLCSLIVPKPLEFILINFVAGIVAVFVLGRAYRRERIFMATAIIFASNCICYIALTLIESGSLQAFNPLMIIWFAANALLFLGMYQLIYLFEKMFGFVSDITLLELSDTNQKLLLELAQKAPGTFQHTLQVANLSEAAAKKIGARALLARTGALYHDIGKMANPAYFIENTNGLVNPHDHLSPAESADIIKHHVSDGLALAKKVRLPGVIQDFITGHHGNSMIYFFYSKQKELSGGENPDPAVFTYAGNKPQLKEVSICMMADAVEAASRSLPVYTEESISNLVDKIIDTQIREGLLSDSALSFHDITEVKEVFKEYLGNIYHTRISYPEREPARVEN